MGPQHSAPVVDHLVVSTRECTAAELGLPGARIFVLWGTIPPRPRLAIVGSRAALHALRMRVSVWVEAASAAGFGVVSGGARGIDAAVHRAALADGVPQLVVAPLGPDRIYPPEHVDLFARVGAHPRSGVLFARPPGTAPSRGMFVSRNALIVGLSDAVLVVQAGMRSGSEHTGRMAARAHAPLAVVLGSSGCATLLEHGAVPVAGAGGVEDFAAWLASIRGTSSAGTVTSPSSDTTWPAQLSALRETLANDTSIAVERAIEHGVLAQLVEAEVLGLVVETTPGQYRRLR